MPYFNTTSLEGIELTRARGMALTQEQELWLLFHNTRLDYTPWEIHHQMVLGKAPITSIRRALTNLTNNGLLEKTAEQRIGPLGKPEYTWQYKSKEPQLALPL